MPDRTRRRNHFRRTALLLGGALVAIACASGGSAGSDEPSPDDTGGADMGGAGGGDTAGAAGSAGATAGGGASGNGASGSAGFPGNGGKGGAAGKAAGGGASGASMAGKNGGGGTSGGAAGSLSGSAGFPTMGGIGAPCNGDTDCSTNTCKDVGKPGAPAKVCVKPCQSGLPCPNGAHCTKLGNASYCIPDRDEPCAACTMDAQCKNSGDLCQPILAGSMVIEHFCAQDCSVDGFCPSGYTCQAAMGTMGAMVCVPQNGGLCPCAGNRDGDTRVCTKTVMGKTCQGVETCKAADMKYEGCTATMPMAETCNGLDDDCDGKVDDLPNATCACDSSGKNCSVACNPGFTHYPPSLPDTAGCPCAVDMAGASCMAPAMIATAITDSGGTADITQTGNLSSDTQVDWWQVQVNDAPEKTTNSFHVRVTFDMNPMNEFQLVVARGGNCAGLTPPLSQYDFCVNYTDAAMMKGEAGCAAPMSAKAGQNECADHSGAYVIGVQRNPAATMKTCNNYVLHVTAAAGPCDTSSFDACGAMQSSPLGACTAHERSAARAITVRWISLVPS